MSNSINDSAKIFFERGISVSEGGSAAGTLIRTSAEQNKFETVQGYGTAVAPAAAAAIATIASGNLPSGYYKVSAQVDIDAGAPAAAERDNMQLQAGATVLKRIIVNPVASGAIGDSGDTYINLNGSTALTVNAVGNATASVVYRASITALRIS